MMRLVLGGVVAVFLVMLVVSGSQSGALSLAVGMLFGTLAGVPAALLVMAAGRGRADTWQNEDELSPPTLSPTVILHNHYHVHLHGGAELPVRNGERPAALVVPEARRLEVR